MTLTLNVDYTDFGERDMHPPSQVVYVDDEPEDMPDPIVNVELLRQVMKQIEADPATWQQEDWATLKVGKTGAICGTSFCAGGWAIQLAGGYRFKFGDQLNTDTVVQEETGEEIYVEAVAKELLGLNAFESASFFDSDNSLADLQRIAQEIADRAGVVL